MDRFLEPTQQEMNAAYRAEDIYSDLQEDHYVDLNEMSLTSIYDQLFLVGSAKAYALANRLEILQDEIAKVLANDDIERMD